MLDLDFVRDKNGQIKDLHIAVHSYHLDILATLQGQTKLVSKQSLRCGSSKYASDPLSFEPNEEGLLDEGGPRSSAFPWIALLFVIFCF
jgi:hypothetical protein